MAAREGSKRVYILSSMFHLPTPVFVPYSHSDAVIEARDINNVPQNPALYVTLALSGNKLSKTEIKRNPTPTWEHTCPL